MSKHKSNLREHTAEEVGKWFDKKVTIEYAQEINEFRKHYENREKTR